MEERARLEGRKQLGRTKTTGKGFVRRPFRPVCEYIISQSRLGGLGLCDGVVCMWYMRGGNGYVVRSVRKDGCCEYTYESSVVCKL